MAYSAFNTDDLDEAADDHAIGLQPSCAEREAGNPAPTTIEQANP